ncbi:hypothetical protein DNTS_007612 [Danionella cerebrum]|uniref:protein-glutamine gamma-glutamyltransferase n=1 Tax=Danionella cerebrum TaxID=2873325 RepID=A0A553MZL7_9TELE|nr:hypothetical protein DNTS_007612 [Danionella translucida]
MSSAPMDELKVERFDLQSSENQLQHRTSDLSSSSALILRRGQKFNLSLFFQPRAFDPLKDKLTFTVTLGSLSFEVPISSSLSSSQWSATLNPSLNAQALSISLISPANASIGIYTLQLKVEAPPRPKTQTLGQFTLLCNPWCSDDSVFILPDFMRLEYIKRDYGMLFKGTPDNMVYRPWSFGQNEKGILDICMKLLDLSPQSLADSKKDLLNRGNAVYIGRIVAAMVNSEDDLGVLMGNWSEDFSDGVNPSQWSGSAEILKTWANRQFRPVKYGQCWVFAAVMCTVLRALGIPSRVVTNFNSAHDTNGNMEIEEYYSETGTKLSLGNDSIWNFHVWVESWMKRPDLGQNYDGWQVLDATPQEISAGMFRCGPASVKAIYEKKTTAPFDVPFVYSEVNADVKTMIIKNGKVLYTKVDKERVGALICTKQPGAMALEDITSQYKSESGLRASYAVRASTQGIGVSLQLQKPPVIGESISFSVTITNRTSVPKQLREHVNAQKKEYDRNPSGAFWEKHNEIKIGPNETQDLKHEISFKEYKQQQIMEDTLLNLAVVVEDVKSQECVLATQEFNITSPSLNIQIENESSVVKNKQQVVIVSFTNPFNMTLNGLLSVAGSGLLEERLQLKVAIQPGENMRKLVTFIPRMQGAKVLHACLVLMNLPSILHGFHTVNVRA